MSACTPGLVAIVLCGLVCACNRVPEPTIDPVDSSTVSQKDASVVDATVTDAADASAACSITLAGAKWSVSCQSWVDTHCCEGERTCANDIVCASWVECIDKCSGSSDPICQKKCGPIRIGFQAAYNCMFDPPDGSPRLPPECVWP